MQISDIDLRFVEGFVPAPEFGEDIVKTVRVLQWRKLALSAVPGPFSAFNEPKWTEWQDVPFVDAPTQEPKA